MGKIKTQAINDTSIKNVQLLIDSELLELAGGWEKVIASFAYYIGKTELRGDILEIFSGFRVMFIFWLKNNRPDESVICKEWIEYIQKYVKLTKPVIRDMSEILK